MILLGKRVTEDASPGDPRNVETTREYVRSGFRVLDHESHEVDVHGSRKIFRNSLIGIIENGKLVRTWGIQRDVTEQVRLEKARTAAEAALRKSEEHFRLLVEQATDGIFVADADGRYTDANSAGVTLERTTGRAAGKLSICEVVAPSDVARIASEISRFAEGATIRSEWTFAATMLVSPGEVSGKQLPDGRLQGILRDMSERRQAEQSIRRSEERFRVALKDSRLPSSIRTATFAICGSTIRNCTGNLTFWARPMKKFSAPKSPPKLTSLKRQVLMMVSRSGMKSPYAITGRASPSHMTIEPLFDSNGNVVGITGAYMDIAKIPENLGGSDQQDSRDR